MIGIVLSLSLLLRIWYALIPSVIWWDSAMYIGIGKYIFSTGQIGIFEMFRPVGLPLILGFLWKIGLDPLFWGKILELSASMGTVYGVYKIGELLKNRTGIYAATLLSLTPIFFAFSIAPLSDIPSAFFATVAVYCILSKRYFWAGLMAGMSFLIRFPEALMTLSLGVSVFFIYRSGWKENIKKALFVLLGSAVIVLPYFIVMALLYHNPLLPILNGNKVAAASYGTSQSASFFFYIRSLCTQNPFLIFALGAFLPFFKRRLYNDRSVIIPLLISTLMLGGYFTLAAHKELRYSISFLPFISILAGYGISLLVTSLPWNYTYKEGAATGIIAITLLSVCLYAYSLYKTRLTISPEQQAYYEYLTDKGFSRIVTSSPPLVATADIRIGRVFTTWEEAEIFYSELKTTIDYIAFNTCELSSSDTMHYQEMAFYRLLDNDKRVFDQSTPYCRFVIYKHSIQ